MSRARLVLLGIAALVITIAALGVFAVWSNRAASIYIFDGVNGPAGQDHIVRPKPTTIAEFDHGSPHRLAVLVTDPDSNWLGLARAFKAQGIPFTITQDANRAFQHKVVLIYPIISGRAMSAQALRTIATHVDQGGAVLGFDLEGGGVNGVFGVGAPIPSRNRETLHWAGKANAPAEEQVTRISRKTGEVQVGSFAYPVQGADVIARYEDGGAAITCKRDGGKACLMGVDLGTLGQRAADGRAEPIARDYVNSYEPSLDVIVRWVRDLYVENEPMPWLIDTVPNGHEVSIVLTHDIDFTRSVINSRGYADLEKKNGIGATYFMQTKYVRDFNDDVFLTKQTVPELVYWRSLGMELASHTVAHSKVMKDFPIGDGREHYPDYHPFVQTRMTARDGTVFGEARVSKYLIEHFTGAKVVSFRPGHLSYPFKLPEVLEATGYQFSSSSTANSSITHLPHQLTFAREGKALSPIYEFPVTIEDEEEPKLGDRFEAASTVVSKIAANHGLVVVLIHPDVQDHKLDFERRLIERWKDRAWMPDLQQYGTWWRARDKAEIDITPDGSALMINAPENAQNIVVLLPKAKGVSKRGTSYKLAGGRLVLDQLKGETRIPLR